ncbi:DUF6316 family protein [Agaribacterium sp. ZY112]|uniref:DUF6316 family protein n=1 Tax=Agaribacterium sp. ZY112 TaxID=3233574 RepID=UPI00352387B7
MTTMELRKGEVNERTYFRADRIFSVADEYFFYTREGNTIGPYPGRSSALKGIELYLEHLEQGGSPASAGQTAIHGLWATSNFQ